MRVLMVEPSGWGGIALYTHALCAALAAQGVTVRLLGNANRDDLRSFDRNFEMVPLVRGDAWNNEWRRLRGEIDAFAPDIFHMQAVISSRRDWLAFLRHRLRGERVRYLCTVHNVLPHEVVRFERQAFRLLYRFADGLIVHSQASLQRLKMLAPGLTTPVEVIHHGHYGLLFDAPPVAREEALAALGLPDARYIVSFGAIRPYKGVDWLLRAVAGIADWPDDLRVLIAGNLLTGVSREELEGLRRELGLEQRVEFRFRYFHESEIPAIYAVTDLMALPYRDIDQSGVMMATLAAGKPVACTPVGAFPEVVDDGVGFVAADVSPEAFAVTLRQAIEHRQDWVAMGERAAAHAATSYGWEAAAARTAEFYRRLAGDHG